MKFKNFMLILGMVCLAAVIVFSWGCQNQPTAPEDTSDVVPESGKTRYYDSGTHDGYWWGIWYDDASGWVDFQLGSGGNYSVSWDYAGNFTCGKGWSTGDPNRIVGYNCGVFNHNGGGGSFAVYGWARNPLNEYYINEMWPGSNRPTGTYRGSVYSDGANYDVYTNIRYNAPSIDGTTTFTQIFSTRSSKAPTGQNRTVTFRNHYNAWSSVGYGLGTMNAEQILLTESWGGGSGYVNATVWGAGSSSGGGSTTTTTSGGSSGITGLKQLRNRGTGLYLDGLGRTNNGADVAQWANTNHPNAHWNITSAGSGYYYLINQATNMKLDGYGRTSNGSACAQYSSSTTHPNAQWRIESAGSGYYYVINRSTNMKLDGYGRTSNGSTCAQYSSSTTHPNAQWQIVE